MIGVLPRKKGDIGRKERRAPAGLPVSRPVEPATQKQRDRLLAAFKEWLRTQGLSFGIFLEGDPDVDSLNSILVTFGKQLYEAGRSSFGCMRQYGTGGGWTEVAGILALTWRAVLRIGEALAATREQLLLPQDVGYTVDIQA